MMVSPSGFKLAVPSWLIKEAVQRMKDKGIEPDKVLCPCLLDERPVDKWERGKRGVPEELFGVRVGLGSELVVVPSDGSMAVWEHREI